jgi:hypothetical protein
MSSDALRAITVTFRAVSSSQLHADAEQSCFSCCCSVEKKDIPRLIISTMQTLAVHPFQSTAESIKQKDNWTAPSLAACP